MGKTDIEEQIKEHLLMCDLPLDQINPVLKLLTNLTDKVREKERERIIEAYKHTYDPYDIDLADFIKFISTTR